MSNMKRVAFWGCLGCGGIVLLLVLFAAGGIGWIAYEGYNFGHEVSKVYQGMVTEYKQLESEFSFTPPEDNLLEEARLKEYLEIREHMELYAKEIGQKLEDAGEAIGEKFDEGGISSFFGGISKIKEIAHLGATMGAEMGHEHVKKLRESEMSVDEYQWLTGMMLGTFQQADQHDFQAGITFWDEYLKKFDTARQQFGRSRGNAGNFKFDSAEMNIQNLTLALEDIPYEQDNADLLADNMDSIGVSKYVCIIDFLALYLDDVVKEMDKNTKPAPTPSGE